MGGTVQARALAVLIVSVVLAGCNHTSQTCTPFAGPAVGDGYNAGDVRLTPLGSFAAGTIARPGDSDLIAYAPVAIANLRCAPGTLRYGDSNSNTQFDAGEVLHVLNGATTGVKGIRMIGNPYGSHVQAGDADYSAANTDLDGRACRVAMSAGDQYFLNFNNGMSVAAGDVRLTPVSGGPVGERLTAAQPTHVFQACVDFEDALKHIDLNADGRYDMGDATIIDFGTATTSSSSSSATATSTSTITSSSSTSTGPMGTAYIDVIDVLQGDSTLIRFPDSTILIDAADRFATRYERVLDRLDALGVHRIDHFVLTHSDADHTGGCQHVFNHTGLEVVNVYHPGWVDPSPSAAWQGCLNHINGVLAPGPTGTVYTDTQLNPGQVIPMTMHATVRLLAINAMAGSDPNDSSIVLRFDHGAVSWITTGDADFGIEDGILAAGYNVDVDILQVGHHGSGSSTDTDWLAATSPELGTISSGVTNPHGHPDPGTLARLANQGTVVCRTDTVGTIQISSNAAAWTLVAPSSCGTAPTTSSSSSSSSTTTSSSSTSTSTGTCTGAMEITNILHSPSVSTAEWVEITNHGPTQVMTGWTLEDAVATTYPFPTSFTLPCNAMVKVHTDSGTNTATDLWWNRSSAVWNNSGDTATLRNGSTVVDAYTYP